MVSMQHMKFNQELEAIKYYNSSLVLSIHFCYNIHLNAQFLYYFTNNKVYKYGVVFKRRYRWRNERGSIGKSIGIGMDGSRLKGSAKQLFALQPINSRFMDDKI